VDYGDGQTQSYTFDAMGNRLQRQDSASGTTTYAYNAANMLLSTSGYGASGFQNDADGNTLTGNGRTNAWDSQNRLVSCLINGNTTAYKYGADGLRRQAAKNGVSTDSAYDGSMLVREGHASGGSLTPATVTATYFIGARGPEYRRDDTATEVDSQGRTVTKARWYVYDGLGSVVGEVDPSGNLTSSPKYDVYGAVRANGGTATSKQGFVGSLGHVSDDTGLVYMRARYYDPAAGRFISEDPAQSGNNWFVYCDNNPVNRVDVSGSISAQDFEVFLQLWQDIELGVGGTASNPAPGSVAAVLAAAGGSVKMLMKVDFAFEAAAANGIDMTAEEAGYIMWKQSVMDAIGVARGYVGTYIAGSEAEVEMETATDLLIDIL